MIVQVVEVISYGRQVPVNTIAVDGLTLKWHMASTAIILT